jgi:beta-glucosidase
LEQDEALTDGQIDEIAHRLLDRLTLEEKMGQMAGDAPILPGLFQLMRNYNIEPIVAGESERLGLPGIRFSDGPRGVVMYQSTCFPVSMARGASWDVDLERRIGDAIGVEARSQGANFFGGVCINLLRHPAWGRAQETYGEDPFHLGEMGAALTEGVQRHIMACIKHFACNSIENARFKVDVQIDERPLREVYLPHFRRCIEAGAASVMGAYNRVNGAYCCHNDHLLCDVLKGDWSFDGFVISDFVLGVRDATAPAAGLDVEMPVALRFGRRGRGLKRALRRGQVSLQQIDEAVLRILRTQIRFAQVGEPERYGEDAVLSAEHLALAREAAVKSMVLLKNAPPRAGASEPLLPLDLEALDRIAVIGRLADMANTGDRGSSDVRAPYVVTPLAGIRDAAGDGGPAVVFDTGRRVEDAAGVAANADVAILVAGYTHAEEGEYISSPFGTKGGDRESLTLSPHDEALIHAVAAANKRTVVALIGGSAIVTEAWRQEVPAILMAWYAGMEGGHALADILSGDANPSGKLPCVFPRSADDLPFFDRDADAIEYGLFHGYRLLQRRRIDPAFHFGYGLSYSSYTYSSLRLSDAEMPVAGSVSISVDVTNTGARAGEEIVQLYVGAEGSCVERSIRELKGFERVALSLGETKTVCFHLPATALAFYDVQRPGWVVEPLTYGVSVGPSSDPTRLMTDRVRVVRA